MKDRRKISLGGGLPDLCAKSLGRISWQDRCAGSLDTMSWQGLRAGSIAVAFFGTLSSRNVCEDVPRARLHGNYHKNSSNPDPSPPLCVSLLSRGAFQDFDCNVITTKNALPQIPLREPAQSKMHCARFHKSTKNAPAPNPSPTLCEPAQSKCVSRFYKVTIAGKLPRKTVHPRVRTLIYPPPFALTVRTP